jgi:hypothetical protein
LEGCWSLWWGVIDSIYSCNGDKFFDAYCLIVKIPGFFIALHRGFDH